MVLLLSVAIAILGCVHQPAAAGEPQVAARDAENDGELPPVEEVELPGDDDEFLLRSDNYLSDEIETRGRLAPLLKQKIAAIDRFCGLSGIQRRKLELSGRGDIKRRLDAIERARSRLRRARNDAKQATEIRHEIEVLCHGRNVRPFADGSLFDKSLKVNLTAEQLAGYEAYRTVVLAHGEIQCEPEGVFEIRLSKTTFGDEDLAQLKALTKLQRLFLDGTLITDAGLEPLEGLTGLIELSLSHTSVKDAALIHLKGLTNLQWLSLAGTCITDAGLARLGEASRLKGLRLADTEVSDDGLVHLARLTNLEKLDLRGTHVTDAGLQHLKQLRSLRRLRLTGTRATENGTAELKSVLPDVDMEN
jgi:hypothetical protein